MLVSLYDIIFLPSLDLNLITPFPFSPESKIHHHINTTLKILASRLKRIGTKDITQKEF